MACSELKTARFRHVLRATLATHSYAIQNGLFLELSFICRTAEGFNTSAELCLPGAAGTRQHTG